MKEHDNFFEVWGGISGCQHLLPSLFYIGMSLERIAELTSKQVAERFGINQKGEIAIGKDADFTIVDVNGEEAVTAESLFYRHRHSPYVGHRFGARVLRTVLRGQTIFEQGKPAGSPKGRFVRPNRT